MDLEKIREAAERVARSEGLEIFDIEWKIGKQRLLRVYIDRLPGPANPEGLSVTHPDCQRVSEQLSVTVDVPVGSGTGLHSRGEFARLGSKVDKGGRLRAVRGPQGENLAERTG